MSVETRNIIFNSIRQTSPIVIVSTTNNDIQFKLISTWVYCTKWGGAGELLWLQEDGLLKKGPNRTKTQNIRLSLQNKVCFSCKDLLLIGVWEVCSSSDPTTCRCRLPKINDYHNPAWHAWTTTRSLNHLRRTDIESESTSCWSTQQHITCLTNTGPRSSQA